MLPHLIVVPGSTLNNWLNEFRRFCPSFNIISYHGSQKERAEMRYTLKEELYDRHIDVIICTYTIFERDSGKDDRKFLHKQNFDYLVLDEAHCIKNAESSRYANLNAIQTRNRLLLSGTPVQNDLGELLALLSFLMPKVFGKRNCKILMEVYGWGKTSQENQQKDQPRDLKSLSQLKGMLAPFVLRRLKSDVLDQLSAKTVEVVKLEMSSFQQNLYESMILCHADRKQELKMAFAEAARTDRLLDGTIERKKSNKVEFIVDNSVMDLTVENCIENKDVTSDFTTDELTNNTSSCNSLVNTLNEQPNATHNFSKIEKMSATEARHLFTTLRKAANHPLLLRVHYRSNEVLDRIAQAAYHNEHFGNQCDYQRVRDEIEKMSDYDLHLICLEYPSLLKGCELEATALYNSPKMEKLRGLLPTLQVLVVDGLFLTNYLFSLLLTAYFFCE